MSSVAPPPALPPQGKPHFSPCPSSASVPQASERSWGWPCLGHIPPFGQRLQSGLGTVIGPVWSVGLSVYFGMGPTAPSTRPGEGERWLPEEGMLDRTERRTCTLTCAGLGAVLGTRRTSEELQSLLSCQLKKWSLVLTIICFM